jgi:hypothetical protein
MQGCVDELVLNFDEVGISDWEDRKMKAVIVTASVIGQTMHHGVSRSMKHTSFRSFWCNGCQTQFKQSSL